MSQQGVRQLGDREDEDQVEEQFGHAHPAARCAVRAQQRACWLGRSGGVTHDREYRCGAALACQVLPCTLRSMARGFVQPDPAYAPCRGRMTCTTCWHISIAGSSEGERLVSGAAIFSAANLNDGRCVFGWLPPQCSRHRANVLGRSAREQCRSGVGRVRHRRHRLQRHKAGLQVECRHARSSRPCSNAGLKARSCAWTRLVGPVAIAAR
jgi:hypothetical protein